MKIVQTTTTLLALTLSLLLPGISIAEPETHEGKRAALFTGTAVVGGALGGPIGLFAGAIASMWLGENVAKGYEYDSLEQDLQDVQLTSKNKQLKLERKILDAAETTARYQRLASETLKFQVLFHTGESALLADSENRISQLAQFLAEQPSMNLLLSGYADPRGDDTYNEQLSAQRVESITELFEAWGVPRTRITTRSFGASQSQAAEKDYDAYALERRVTIELLPSINDASVARTTRP